ncbi:MAG: oxidoreductase domain protein [Bryobacterales bacterium]|nr:oxidoreductase domain protein [Bryobacterales bacterium]
MACAGENIVALADPDVQRAAPIFKRFRKVPKYADFRRMFDRENKSIDAVLVSTPDFLHGTQVMWALERGKHVHCQKPLTRTISEARMVTDAAAKARVATQMGNQGYSTEGIRRCAQLVQSGAIGSVTEVHAWTNRPVWPQGMQRLPGTAPVPRTLDWQNWLGPAPTRPYSPAYVPFNWRGWVDFGCGALGDMGCHVLGPANVALKLGAPESVECVRLEGRSACAFPKKSVIRFDFPSRGPLAPVKILWYDGVPGPPDLRAAPARHMGNGGSLFVGEHGYLSTGAYGEGTRLLSSEQLKTYRFRVASREPISVHYQNWIRSAKEGKQATSDFRIAGPFTEWVLLGALSLRVKGKLEWDSAAMRVTNIEEANEFLRPTIRDGWQFR